MITSLYRGGLGNQLFEIAAGYALARDNDDEYCINPSLHREYGQGNHINTYIDNIFTNISKTTHQSQHLYKEPQFNYNAIPYIPNSLLDGYFQSEKYFKNHKSELNCVFGFECPESTTDICTIHIRTGDFLQLSNFDVVTPKYFTSAIQYVRLLTPHIKFQIITDDFNAAKRYIPDDLDYTFISTSELEDLKAMSVSDYAIISNSSFGWWGSYLGKPKTTIVPDRWFNNVNYDVSDLYRDDMIKIST